MVGKVNDAETVRLMHQFVDNKHEVGIFLLKVRSDSGKYIIII